MEISSCTDGVHALVIRTQDQALPPTRLLNTEQVEKKLLLLSLLMLKLFANLIVDTQFYEYMIEEIFCAWKNLSPAQEEEAG